MTTWAVSMFHDEEDVAPWVVRHMLAECDAVLVADNRSTDASRALLEAIGDPRLSIVDEPSIAYRQADTMNRLAKQAYEAGATWIVPFDFDERWSAEGGRIADVLAALPGRVIDTATTTIDLVPQPDDPAEEPDPFARCRWTRPGSYWSTPQNRKIAYRPAPGRFVVQGNHSLVGRPMPSPGPLRIRHLPYRSLAQATRKVRHGKLAIEAADLPAASGAHWQILGGLPDVVLAGWWADWTKREGLVMAP